MSIRDVAQRAGVSIATVSRAVNGISTVAPELAERVWSAIKEVGYVPNTQARALVSGRSRMLGLVVSEITNPFFPELVQEFENLAVEQGYEVFIGSTNYEAVRTEALIRRMLQRSVDGVAIMTFGIEEELIQKLVERAFPLVFVDAGPDLPNIRVLKVNYGEGIREAVQHLAALGHRQIAFISGPLQMRSAVARRDAFLGAMAELGLQVPPEHLSKALTPWKAASRPANNLLALGELPTGIVCSNDMTAIGVLHGLHRTTQRGAARRLRCGVRRHSPCAVHAAAAHHDPDVVQASGRRRRAGSARRHRAGSSPGTATEWHIPTQLVVRQSTSFPRGSLPALAKTKPAVTSRRREIDNACPLFALLQSNHFLLEPTVTCNPAAVDVSNRCGRSFPARGHSC